MTHYFFDVVGHRGSALDYRGRILHTADEAYNAAELLALDLAVAQVEEAIGSRVTVSDAYGRQLFTIPIRQSYLSATSDHEPIECTV
jgi:hypothetical protein